jgi:hypothetical protein
MNRVELETKVFEAMQNDNVVDGRETSRIVRDALSDGRIDASELVIARNSLERSKQYLARMNDRMNNAEIRVDNASNPIELAKAVAHREKVRAEQVKAQNRMDAYQRIEGLFRSHASWLDKRAADIANVVGDIGRGIGEIFED